MTEGRQKRLQLSTKIFVNTENNSHSIQQKLRNTVSVFTTNKSLLQRGRNRCYKVTEFSVFLHVSCNIQSVHNSPHLKDFIGSWLFAMCEDKALSGAHQMEPPSPIQALGVNPFPSRFIIRTVPRGDFTRRRWEEPITTTKWQCYCTSSNSRKFGVDRPNTIIS